MSQTFQNSKEMKEQRVEMLLKKLMHDVQEVLSAWKYVIENVMATVILKN